MDALMDEAATLYRTLWRWHFYAALFVIPFILILSVTGAIYLFKPQIEAWEEGDFRRLPTAALVAPSQQIDAALAAFPDARFDHYRIPQAPSDAALVHLEMPGGSEMRDVFVSPQGKVVGSLNPETRVAEFVSRVHSTVLLGKAGSWAVELAASWAIVMILTGLYLWAPRGRGLAGVIWPRLHLGSRAFWRDLHAVTGFWVSGLALVLLVSGMPWAGVWGDAFKAVRTQAGWVQGKQDWKTGGEDHSEHDHGAMVGSDMVERSASIDAIIAAARAENLAFPVIVTPPGGEWIVKSNAQNRPLRATLTYDAVSGQKLSDERFADRHSIDRAVGYGIAWHEGQLFGWANQLVGLLTALALITLSVSGFVMWRRRKPKALLGAPPQPSVPAGMKGVTMILIILAALLPMLAVSLIFLWLFERLILPRLPRLSNWLGLKQAA
jgi:uncharacterized iron-regulated membrane protein